MFGLSGSSSRTRTRGSSQSTSSSFGRSASEQGAESGSFSGGASRSAQQSTSASRVAFEDVFSRLFSGAEGAVAGLDPSLLTDAANDLFSGGQRFLEGIGGDEGTAFLTERLARSDELEQQELDLLQSDIGDLFREELLPGITSEAVAGGQLGGGRQGVAEGIATEAAADAFTRGAVNIKTRNRAQLDELAAGIAQRNIQGAQIGLAGNESLAQFAEMGFGANLRGIEFLANILGGPTVLTDSQSSGFASAEDFARAFSESFGRSASESGSESQSTSTTTSRSKSKSGGIGFG